MSSILTSDTAVPLLSFCSTRTLLRVSSLSKDIAIRIIDEISHFRLKAVFSRLKNKFHTLSLYEKEHQEIGSESRFSVEKLLLILSLFHRAYTSSLLSPLMVVNKKTNTNYYFQNSPYSPSSSSCNAYCHYNFFYPKTCFSPLAFGSQPGVVYVVVKAIAAETRLYALLLSEKKILWSTTPQKCNGLPSKLSYKEAPCVDAEGNIYVRDKEDSQIYCFSSKGDLLNTFEFASKEESKNAVSSPLLVPSSNHQTIYVLDNNNLYTCSNSQQQKHELTAFPEKKNLKKIIQEKVVSFIVSSEDILYTIDSQATLQAVSPQGEKLKTLPLKGDWKTPQIGMGPDGTLYIADGQQGKLYLVSPNMEILLECTLEKNSFTPYPVIIDSQGIIYWGSDRGVLYAISPHNGQELWQLHLDPQLTFTFLDRGSDGILYAASNVENKLYCIFPKQQKWKRYKIKCATDDSRFTNLALDPFGRLHLQSLKGIYALDNIEEYEDNKSWQTIAKAARRLLTSYRM